MKIIFLLTFFIAITFANNLILTNKEKNFLKSHNTITLGTGKGWEPANIVNENGLISGFDYDILQLINKATGANFKLVSGNWQEIQKQVKNKELDGLMNIVKTPQREKFLNFSSAYTKIEYSLATDYKNKNKINIKDIQKLTIGIQKGHVSHENIIKELNFKNIVYIKNYLDGYDKLANKEINVIPSYNGFNYVLSKKSLPMIKDTNLYHKQIPVYVGILKDYPEAMTIFQKGLKTISDETLEELRAKWNMSISDDAKLTNKKYIFLGNSSLEPFLFNEDEVSKGLVYELTEAIFNEAKIDAEIKLLNWADAQKKVQEKEADGLIQLNINDERKKYLDFSKPLLNSQFLIYKKSSRDDISDLNSLSQKKVGVEKKGYANYLIKNNPKIDTVIIKSWEEGFKLINENKIDALITDKWIGDYTLNKYDFKSIDTSSIILESNYSHIAVSKENKELLEKINYGIEQITRNGIKEKILNKWIGNKLVYLSKQELEQLKKISQNSLFTEEEIEYLKKNPTIKVGHSSVFEPLFFKDSSGNLNGIIIDTYKFLSSKYGFDVEFIDNSWKETINDLKNGNIDVIPSINKKIVKKENLLPAQPISKASFSVFTKDKKTFTINSLEDLYGKTVAFNDNIIILKKFLKKYKDKIKSRGQKTTLEAFFLLENQKVDAVITFHTDKYILAKYEIKDIHSIHTLTEIIPGTTAAVKPNDKILQSIINKSINNLSLEEKNNILEKWLGNNEENDKKLNIKELDFLKNNQEFKVCTRYEHYPIDGVENGKIIGIAGQVYDEISKRLNIKFVPLASNTLEEFRNNVNTNRCDLISIAKNTYEGFDEFTFTKPILTQFFVSIGSIKNPYIGKLSQLNHTFYVKEEIFKEEFLRSYPKAKVIVNSNIDEVMEKIKKDSNSHFILSTYTADEIIRKYGPDEYKIDDIFDEIKAEGAIFVNKKYPLLYSSINKTIESFSKEELNSFASNYRLSKYVIETSYAWLWYVLFILLIVIALLQARFIKKMKERNQKEKNLTDSLSQARKIAKISSFVNNFSKNYYEEIDDSIYDIFEISSKDYPKINRELLFNHIHPDDKENFKKKLLDSYQSSKEQFAEYRIITANKKIKYILTFWKVIHDKTGKAIKTVATIQDITEKVLIEKERVAQEILLQKQSKLALQGEMLSMIAHQWRQPLNQLSVLVQMFVRKVEPKVQEKDEFIFFKNTTTDIIKHLSQTIEDFSNFYKPDKKKETFVLEEFYRSLKVLLNNRIENLIIEFNSLEKLSIYTFRNELSQVLLTMINNSIEAKEDDNLNFYIKLSNKLEDDKLIIKIEDNAGGIPDNIINSIFDPYFSTKEEKNGTGLGLYMSKLIVEDSIGGEISVKTQNNITIFTIQIPVENQG